MIFYKWTRTDLTTHDGYQYTYPDPLLAVFMKPIHVDDDHTVLWECNTESTTLTLIQRIDPPIVTPAQRVRFAILIAWQSCEASEWRAWAARWLSGEDRSWQSAKIAAWVAAHAEAGAGTWAWAAAAAKAAAHAAQAAAAAKPVLHPTAWAAALAVAKPIDLVALAHQAVREEPQH